MAFERRAEITVGLRHARSVMLHGGPGEAPDLWGLLGAGYEETAELDDAMVATFERARRQYPGARKAVLTRERRGLIVKTWWVQLWIDGVLKLERPEPLAELIGALDKLWRKSLPGG